MLKDINMKRIILLAGLLSVSASAANAQAIMNLGGAPGSLGELVFNNATSGTITMAPATGALGTVTATVPANSGTLSETNLAESFTAAKTFTNSDLLLLGSSTGATTFTSANAGASNFTITVPAATDTLGLLGTAQTFTAAKTFTNSDLLLLGSSTGVTTFTSANAGASNFTITVPASTSTLITSTSTLTSDIPVTWDSNTTVANGTIPISLPPWVGGGTITSVSYYTNGTGTPSFTANVQIGGTGVTGCSALSVSSATPATTNCTALNTFTSSSSLALVISSVAGTPNQAIVQINFTHTPN